METCPLRRQRLPAPSSGLTSTNQKSLLHRRCLTKEASEGAEHFSGVLPEDLPPSESERDALGEEWGGGLGLAERIWIPSEDTEAEGDLLRTAGAGTKRMRRGRGCSGQARRGTKDRRVTPEDAATEGRPCESVDASVLC